MKLLASLALHALLATTAAAQFVTVNELELKAPVITGAGVQTAHGLLVTGGLGDAPGEWRGKVVLLDRGEISFARKVGNAHAAGAAAVIIANNVPGEFLPTLAPETSPIIAVAITKADGEKLRTRVGELVRVGTQAARPLLPDPRGNAGRTVRSDGEKYVLGDAPSASASAELPAGSRVTLGVSADGSPPFEFQWLKDGTPIAGATSAALAIASLTAADSGVYVCQVINKAGTTTSTAQTITVK